MKFKQLQVGQMFIIVIGSGVNGTYNERAHPAPVFIKTPLAETRVPGDKEPHPFNAINLPMGTLLHLSEEQEVLSIAFQYEDILVDIRSYTKKKLLELHGIISEALS